MKIVEGVNWKRNDRSTRMSNSKATLKGWGEIMWRPHTNMTREFCMTCQLSHQWTYLAQGPLENKKEKTRQKSFRLLHLQLLKNSPEFLFILMMSELNFAACSNELAQHHLSSSAIFSTLLRIIVVVTIQFVHPPLWCRKSPSFFNKYQMRMEIGPPAFLASRWCLLPFHTVVEKNPHFFSQK